MTKQIAKLAAVAALSTLALTACGGTSSPTTGATTGGATTGGASTGSTSGSTAASKGASSAAAGGAAALACPSGKLTGEGSSAQKTAVDEIVNAYNDKCKNKATIEYNPTGSGAGIKSFNGKLVDWAGSDSALKTSAGSDGTIEADAAKARCGGNPAWNLPMVVGPVAFAYNVAGVKDLVLTPEVLSKIFYGQITTWDDAAIKALNPNAKLASDKITVFFRSDESGTSENVSKFLKAAGKGAWADDASKKWTGKAGEGKAKSSGVAEAVKQTPNSITYVEWSYATDNKLSVAKIDNGKGAVELTGDTVAKAVSGAKIAGQGNDLKLDLKYTDTEAGAYPALLVTYEIVCSAGLEADKTALLKDFLGFFASAEGQKDLLDLGYAPLPADLQTKVATAIKAVK